jgi:hypothetical protein
MNISELSPGLTLLHPSRRAVVKSPVPCKALWSQVKIYIQVMNTSDAINTKLAVQNMLKAQSTSLLQSVETSQAHNSFRT